MSPTLFNMYIADLDKKFEKRNRGGVDLGGGRIWTLAYADDMVLLARNKEAMTDMMGVLKKFLREREMELNAKKTKVLIFNSTRRKKKEKWKWGKETIEEVKTFKYLGFVFNNKGNYVDHIKELCRKGRIAAARVWGLGERICRNDFKRRWMLFRYLVQSVMSYGVEVWGWEEKRELEKVMLDYVRWMLRLDFCTPRYIIRRELGLEKLKITWGIRAIEYEIKIEGKKETELVTKCRREKGQKGGKDLYSIERERYFNKNGWSVEYAEKRKEEGSRMKNEIRERNKDIQKQEEESKIMSARYNKEYKKIMLEQGFPRYLKEEEGSNKNEKLNGNFVRALMRTRVGNLEEENKYWLEESKRKCAFCGIRPDKMEHYVRECEEIKEWFAELGNSEEERLKKIRDDTLNNTKGRALLKLWKEKERIMIKEYGEAEGKGSNKEMEKRIDQREKKEKQGGQKEAQTQEAEK